MVITAAKINIPVQTGGAQAKINMSGLNAILQKLDATLGRNSDSLDDLNAHLKKTKKETKDFGDTLKKVFAGGAALLVTKTLVSWASDAEETGQKFGVVFKSIQNEAQAAADVLKNSYGQSGQEAQKLLSDTGDLLTGFGFTQKAALNLSTELNTLAIDLASFTNIEGGTARASAALTSALFGEREAAKALGIVITEDALKSRLAAQGKAKLTGEALLQAKAEETLKIAYEQSKNAIGDFQRSQNSFANVSRRVTSRIKDMGAEIGAQLLPALSNLGLAFLGATGEGNVFLISLKGIASAAAKVIGVITTAADTLNAVAMDKQYDIATVAIDKTNTAVKNHIQLINKLYKTAGQKQGVTPFKAMEASALAGDKGAQALLNTYTRLIAEAQKAGASGGAAANSLEGIAERLTGFYGTVDAAIEGTATTQTNVTKSIEDTSKAQAEYNKRLTEALQIQAKTGDIGAGLSLLKKENAEQLALLKSFGIDTTALEKSYAATRITTIQDTLTTIAMNEKMSFADRETELSAAYQRLKNTEKLSQDERLKTEAAFTQASQQLAMSRMKSYADAAELYGGMAGSIIAASQSVAQIFANQDLADIEQQKAKNTRLDEAAAKQQALYEEEIARLKSAQATKAEITAAEETLEAFKSSQADKKAARDKKLAKDELKARQRAAKQQKVFGIFSTIIDTSIAVTKTLATIPGTAGWIAAALTGAKGLAETIAIGTTPIPAAAFGGRFTVPPGAAGDSALLNVSSGEEVSVTPARENRSSGFDMSGPVYFVIDGKSFSGYLTETVNSLMNNGSVRITRKGVVVA